jgi:hypothetical protein
MHLRRSDEWRGEESQPRALTTNDNDDEDDEPYHAIPCHLRPFDSLPECISGTHAMRLSPICAARNTRISKTYLDVDVDVGSGLWADGYTYICMYGHMAHTGQIRAWSGSKTRQSRARPTNPHDAADLQPPFSLTSDLLQPFPPPFFSIGISIGISISIDISINIGN